MSLGEFLILLRRHSGLAVGGGIAGLCLGLLLAPAFTSATQTVTTRTAIEIKAAAEVSDLADGTGDTATLLENAVSLGLSDTDYESVAAAAALVTPVAALEGAIQYKRMPDSAVLEVIASLPDYDQAAIVASTVTDLLIRNAEQLLDEELGEIAIITRSESDRSQSGSVSLAIRRIVFGAAMGFGLGLAAPLLAYAWRPVVLGRSTIPSAVALPVIATVGERDPDSWQDSTDPGVLLAKLKAAPDKPAMRFLVLVCGTPAQAALTGHSRFVEGLAEALGDETLVLASDGDSGCETLPDWPDLARVGPYRAHVVLDPSIQNSRQGATYLDELTMQRPVILVTSLTPLAVAAGAAASATMPVVFAGLTQTVRLLSVVLDLRQGGASLAGIILVRT